MSPYLVSFLLLCFIICNSMIVRSDDSAEEEKGTVSKGVDAVKGAAADASDAVETKINETKTSINESMAEGDRIAKEHKAEQAQQIKSGVTCNVPKTTMGLLILCLINIICFFG
ncbi:hypothetical protein M5689_007636 [Euphorbia peplus]|nr:hypothetical protein M5689_007636 [Euphorbia peplus]